MKLQIRKIDLPYVWRATERGLVIGLAVAASIELLTVLIVAAIDHSTARLTAQYWHAALFRVALCMAVGAITGIAATLKARIE